MSQAIVKSNTLPDRPPKSIPVLKKSATAVSLPVSPKRDAERSFEEGSVPKKRPKSSKHPSPQSAKNSSTTNNNDEDTANVDKNRRSPSIKLRRSNSKEDSSTSSSHTDNINKSPKRKPNSPPSPNTKDKGNGEESGSGKKKGKDATDKPLRKNSAPATIFSLDSSEVKVKRKVKEDKTIKPLVLSTSDTSDKKQKKTGGKKSPKSPKDMKSEKLARSEGDIPKLNDKIDITKKRNHRKMIRRRKNKRCPNLMEM